MNWIIKNNNNNINKTTKQKIKKIKSNTTLTHSVVRAMHQSCHQNDSLQSAYITCKKNEELICSNNNFCDNSNVCDENRIFGTDKSLMLTPKFFFLMISCLVLIGKYVCPSLMGSFPWWRENVRLSEVHGLHMMNR